MFSLSLSRTQCHDVASVDNRTIVVTSRHRRLNKAVEEAELLVADEATLMEEEPVEEKEEEEDAALLLLVSLRLFHNHHQSLHLQLWLLLSVSPSLSHHRPRWLN